MEAPPLSHLLIFEPDGRGHVHEWLSHILKEASADRSENPMGLSFAVPLRLAEKLAIEVPRNKSESIRFISLSESEIKLCLSRQLVVSGVARWWIMRRYLARTGANHGLFLALDHLTLPLALGLGAKTAKLSGILFRPSSHYHEIGQYRPTLSERIRDARKEILYRLMLLNPALRAVLTLDPYFADYASGRYVNAEKIVSLPDPVFPIPVSTPQEKALADIAPKGRHVLLLFGELTDRKGLLVLLDALAALHPDDAARLAVFVAGRVDPAIASSVKQKAGRLSRHQPGLWFRIIDRRLAPGEIAALTKRSDFVLAPYQRFVGSSGVLLWAARAGKPIISQDYGLVGRLVREHRLGITVESTNINALAGELAKIARECLHLPTDLEAMDRFCVSRTPGHFARLILASVSNEPYRRAVPVYGL